MTQVPDDQIGGDAPLPSLEPNDTVQKILISATARFTDEYKTDSLLITHAWPSFYTGRKDWFREASPLSRTAFVLSFRTEAPIKQVGVVVPNYEPAGPIISSVLSVLFGKRFDMHGPFEMSGHFGVPDLSQFSIPNNPKLPHNGQRLRADFPVPLELSYACRLAPLIVGDLSDTKGLAAFQGAARFYQRALQAVEDDPEIAYLHLITAGEIIANHQPFVASEHIAPATLAALERVEGELEGGAKVARLLRNQVRGIKRRFVSTILKYVQPDFFTRREADDEYSTFKQERFEKHICAAYDLRSRYVHTGESFGTWIAPRFENAEIQFGGPITGNKESERILANAPLFVGLERVIRYVLLAFAVELGADLSGIGTPS